MLCTGREFVSAELAEYCLRSSNRTEAPMYQGPACAGGPLPDMEDIHPAPQELPSAPKGSFDWQQQWYPLVRCGGVALFLVASPNPQ